MEQRLSRLVRWSQGERLAPFKIELYPTNRCNLSCSFCWKQAERNPDYRRELEPQTVLRLVEESARLGSREWFLCGAGEPLTAPQTTLPAMDAIKARDMKGILNTNGFSVTVEMIRHWADIGWEDLHFSIDSCNAKEHDFLRGRKGAFERADAALREAFRIREERKSHVPYLVMISVLSKHNYASALKITEYALHRGINKLIFKEMIQHEHVKPLNLSRWGYWRLRRQLLQSRSLARRHGMVFEFQEAISRPEPLLPLEVEQASAAKQECEPAAASPESVNQPAPQSGVGSLVYDFSLVPCFEFWLSFFVYPNGEAHCGIWGDRVNVRDGSLESLWFGEYFEHMRQRLMAGEIPEMCTVCGRFRSPENQALLAGWRARTACSAGRG